MNTRIRPLNAIHLCLTKLLNDYKKVQSGPEKSKALKKITALHHIELDNSKQNIGYPIMESGIFWSISI